MREQSHPPHVFLKRGARGPADAHFTVKARDADERLRNRGRKGAYRHRRQGTREGPDEVGRGVADVGADAMCSAANVKVERLKERDQ